MDKKMGSEMRLFIGNSEYTADELEAMELCYLMHEEEMTKALHLEVRRPTKKQEVEK